MSQVNHRYHTEVEQAALLRTVRQFATLEARRDAAWIALLRDTGFRIGEFSQMNVAQATLALQKGWLFIPREHRKGRPETRTDHSVPVTDPVRASLQALLRVQVDMGGTGAPGEPLVLSRKGRRMSIRGYQFRYHQWCALAGIEGSPHWMRHTRAMNIMKRSRSTDPRGIVQGALGHTSIASSGIYTRISKEELRRSLEEVDGLRRPRRRQMRRIYEGVAA